MYIYIYPEVEIRKAKAYKCNSKILFGFLLNIRRMAKEHNKNHSEVNELFEI